MQSLMTLTQLRHFVALTEHGSFAQTAKAVFLTQPALTRSIAALEEELGGRLFDRVGRRISLTPFGHEVLERAQSLVRDAQTLKGLRQGLQSGMTGQLRLGLGSGPGAMLMTPWLVHMARHHPGVKVVVSRGPTELQLQQLRDRSLDALVVDVRRVVPAADLRIGQLYDMRAGMLCRPGHPLLAQHPAGVPFEALLAYPVASVPLSDEVARLLVAHYGPQADPAALVTLQCEEIPSLLEAVRQTDAVYLGILGAAHELLARQALVPLPVLPALQAGARLAMVTLAERTELPVMAVFRQFVAQILEPVQAAAHEVPHD